MRGQLRCDLGAVSTHANDVHHHRPPTAKERTHDASAEDFARAYPIFMALYAENTSKRSVLYPGVREGLDFMEAEGYTDTINLDGNAVISEDEIFAGDMLTGSAWIQIWKHGLKGAKLPI